MRYCLVLLLCTCLMAICASAHEAPQWSRLTPPQQALLLEAFSLPQASLSAFSSAVPGELKQAVLDSLWKLLAPEKRLQVLLYAHLEKPFSSAADEAARVLAPEWEQLTQVQRARAYEALALEPAQRIFWEAAPPQLRQSAFATLWAYLEPTRRNSILDMP